jgi:predicted DNA-binding protein
MKISFDLPDELRDLLAELCREEQVRPEDLARRLLLDRLEDFEDVRLAEARLEASGGRGIKLEDVMRDLGLVDEKGERINPAAE